MGFFGGDFVGSCGGSCSVLYTFIFSTLKWLSDAKAQRKDLTNRKAKEFSDVKSPPFLVLLSPVYEIFRRGGENIASGVFWSNCLHFCIFCVRGKKILHQTFVFSNLYFCVSLFFCILRILHHADRRSNCAANPKHFIPPPLSLTFPFWRTLYLSKLQNVFLQTSYKCIWPCRPRNFYSALHYHSVSLFHSFYAPLSTAADSVLLSWPE